MKRTIFSKTAAFATLLALVFSTFPAIQFAQAGPVKKFSASTSPTTVTAGSIRQFTVTFTNNINSDKEIKSGRVTLPLGFALQNPPVPTLGEVTNWEVCTAGSEIQFGRNHGGTEVAPGSSFSVTFTANVPSTGGSYTFVARAFGNDSCSPGNGEEFETNLTPITVIVQDTTKTLTVTKAGTGTGSVTSTPIGINCGVDCTENYNENTVVTLTATPTSNSDFNGWSGAGCSGTGTCVVTMDAAKSVTATFNLKTYLLSVALGGSGTGSVTSAPAGISCASDCSETYNHGTVVSLTATADLGSTFAGWSGACTGTGSCSVTMDAAKSVTATFNVPTPPDMFTLDVAVSGSGSVTSAPAGINCGSDCTEDYDENTIVTLTALADLGSTFAGWSGACSGTGTCSVTMDAAKSVTATFTLLPQCNNNIDDDDDGDIDYNGGPDEEDSDSGCSSPEDTSENEPPVITPTGSNPQVVTLGSSYTELGATANDAEDGPNLVVTVIDSSAVNTAVVGSYSVLYNFTDSDSAPAVQVTRTIDVKTACADGVDNDQDGLTDFNSEGGDPGCADASDNSETDTPPVPETPSTPSAPQTPPAGNGPPGGISFGGGAVLGASTGPGQVLGESCGLYLNKHIRLGSSKNDNEQVKKLQEFLNKKMGTNLPVTGFYGPMSLAAVKAFQAKYGDEILKPWGLSSPTGLVYLSTLKHINSLECPDLGLELPTLIPWSQNPNAQ